MGYRSSGSGNFTLIDKSKEDEAVKKIEEEFEIEKNLDGSYNIRFIEVSMYRAGKMFKKVAEHFNGEFEIEGDDPGDLWRLQFFNGKVFKKIAIITYGEPEETDLDSPEWNKQHAS